MFSRKMIEAMAMMMIGDSVLAIATPSRHVSLWSHGGPDWWERTWEPFVRHPNMTRAMGVVGLAAGIWMATRQQPPARGTLRPMRFRSTTPSHMGDAIRRRMPRWGSRLAEAMR